MVVFARLPDRLRRRRRLRPQRHYSPCHASITLVRVARRRGCVRVRRISQLAIFRMTRLDCEGKGLDLGGMFMSGRGIGELVLEV